jgi:hypothetical protein
VNARLTADEAFASLFQRQQSVKQATQKIESKQQLLMQQQQQRTPSRFPFRRQETMNSSPSILTNASANRLTHNASKSNLTGNNTNYSPYRGTLQATTVPQAAPSDSFRRSESNKTSFNALNNPTPSTGSPSPNYSNQNRAPSNSPAHMTSSASPKPTGVRTFAKPLPELSRRTPSTSLSSVKLEVIESTGNKQETNSVAPSPLGHTQPTPTALSPSAAQEPLPSATVQQPPVEAIPTIFVESRVDSASRLKSKEKDEHHVSIAPVSTTIDSLLSSAKNTPKSTPTTTPSSTRPTTPIASSALISTNSTTATTTTATPGESREGSPAQSSNRRNNHNGNSSSFLASSGNNNLRDSNGIATNIGNSFITSSSNSNERCSTPKRKRSRHAKRSSADKDEKEEKERREKGSRERDSKESRESSKGRDKPTKEREGGVRLKRMGKSLSSEEITFKMRKPARRAKKR